MPKRFLLVVPDELWDRVEEYRAASGLKTTSEAMRTLMSERLAQPKTPAKTPAKAQARQKPVEEPVEQVLTEAKSREARKAIFEQRVPDAIAIYKDPASYEPAKVSSLMASVKLGPKAPAPGSLLKVKKGKG